MNLQAMLCKLSSLFSFCSVFSFGCTQLPTEHRPPIHKFLPTVNIDFDRRAAASLSLARPIVRQGDLILRTGNDFTSESLRQLSFNDKTYSHCGIASFENDTLFVYHALGGEWNPDAKLRRDPIELFCNAFENRGFGIYTYNLSQHALHNLDSIIKSWYSLGYTFDMRFDLSTDKQLYCAEFVCKAIQKSTDNRIIFPISNINSFKFIAIDNLIINNYCIEKLRVRYQ